MSEERRKGDVRFISVGGLERVYEPCSGTGEHAKKHPCGDCHFCQFCSDARCHSCRNNDARTRVCSVRKLSLAEQIRLYERINARSCKNSEIVPAVS